MSVYVPQDLRDATTRKLQAAIERRDRTITRLTQDVASLRSQLAGLEADDARRRQELREVEATLHRSEHALAQHQKQHRAALEAMGTQMEVQRRTLTHQIEEAEARHRAHLRDLQDQVDAVRRARQDKEDAQRHAAADLLQAARQILTGLPEDELEALELDDACRSVAGAIEEAQAVLARSEATAAQAIGAASEAHIQALSLASTHQERHTTIEAHRQMLEQERDTLEALAQGDSHGHLPEQHTDMELYLRRELAVLRGVLQEHITVPIARFTRWNGHVAAMEEILGLCDTLTAELVGARTALLQAAAHDDARISLEHAERDLIHAYDRILHAGEPDGFLAVPEDGKSDWIWLLNTGYGEVHVHMPWVGPVRAVHEAHGQTRERTLAPAVAEPSHAVQHLLTVGPTWRQLSLLWLHPEARRRMEVP